MARYSAIVLAGGDGTRLQSLTRALTGDDRPKQFCRILGHDTLLEQTRRRALMLVESERLLTVVTRRHERFYAPLLANAPPHTVIAQPENRGTATAIALALRRLDGLDPEHPVIVLPSDHYVSDDAAFMARVESACEAVLVRPDLVVLLGIAADRPEVEFGWIEPGALILDAGPWPLYRVARFREKPRLVVAVRLLRQGGLWNSFVLVARPSTLGGLIRGAAPGLMEQLAAVPAPIGRPGPDGLLGRLYAELPATDLSRDVLQRYPADLAMLPVTGLGWNDLGDPGRVVATRAQAQSALASA
jgi:mannose-1-phosphate guanylyltransferase